MVYNPGEGRRFKSCPATKICFLGGIDVPERGFGVLFVSRILKRLRLRGLFVTDKKVAIEYDGCRKIVTVRAG